jgi:hypothetical protein
MMNATTNGTISQIEAMIDVLDAAGTPVTHPSYRAVMGALEALYNAQLAADIGNEGGLAIDAGDWADSWDASYAKAA